VGNDLDRAGDHEKAISMLKREGQSIIRVSPSAAEMQKANKVNADLCPRAADRHCS
jgi:hypothetical protein